MKTKEILDKVIKTIELLVTPVSAICIVWGVDVAAYVAGGASLIISVISYVKLFIKD